MPTPEALAEVMTVVTRACTQGGIAIAMAEVDLFLEAWYGKKEVSDGAWGDLKCGLEVLRERLIKEQDKEVPK